MTSRITADFRQAFQRLPAAVQQKARHAFRLFRSNVNHPSLHFKRIKHAEPIYSVRVGRSCRALGLVEADVITWFWIGSHAEYDRLISS